MVLQSLRSVRRRRLAITSRQYWGNGRICAAKRILIRSWGSTEYSGFCALVNAANKHFLEEHVIDLYTLIKTSISKLQHSKLFENGKSRKNYIT